MAQLHDPNSAPEGGDGIYIQEAEIVGIEAQESSQFPKDADFIVELAFN